jgi:hypothetical protein
MKLITVMVSQYNLCPKKLTKFPHWNIHKHTFLSWRQHLQICHTATERRRHWSILDVRPFRKVHCDDITIWGWKVRERLSVIKRVTFFSGATVPNGPGPPHYRGFTITLRHIRLGRTPLDEWSVRRRDLYLTTHDNIKRQTSMPPAGFEHAIPTNQRSQTHALDRAATGIGKRVTQVILKDPIWRSQNDVKDKQQYEAIIGEIRSFRELVP